jgi:hypothetical protein
VASKFSGYKVWGGRRNIHGNPVRIILAAKSQKEAAGILGITISELKKWWPITGNLIEMSTALAAPGRQMFRFQDQPEGPWFDLVCYPYTREEVEEKERR